MQNKKIAIVTDAWTPQVNGVVHTLKQTCKLLDEFGYAVTVLSPGQHRTVPCPTYPEIRLAIKPAARLCRQLDELQPDYIHIATEGPLGLAARACCIRHNLAFTTSYHTQFPEYVRKRIPMPLAVSYALIRRFHNAAARTMVATQSQEDVLRKRGFKHLVRWSRGVDTDLFTPAKRIEPGWTRPVFTYLGRVAVEKNLDAFLSLDLPGTKCIIGDGPALTELKQRYPDMVFLGYRFGEDLAAHLAAADVFVFPSRTDTFGLVLLEAMACGVPVAAYPVTGPKDLIQPGISGELDEDLRSAALRALHLDADNCRNEALRYSWQVATRQFAGNLVPARSGGEKHPWHSRNRESGRTFTAR